MSSRTPDKLSPLATLFKVLFKLMNIMETKIDLNEFERSFDSMES